MNYLTPEQRAFGWSAGDSAGKSWFREDVDRNECRARIASLIRDAENDLIESHRQAMTAQWNKALELAAEIVETCGHISADLAVQRIRARMNPRQDR